MDCEEPVGVFPEFHRFDGLGLAELVRSKQILPAELVEEAISRIEAHNPRINAVICKMYEQARKAAQEKLPHGPFQGVPFLLKDMHATVEGVPTSCGTRMLKDFRQPHDSEIVRRYRASGVIFIGKTNVPEFCLLPYTEPEAFGPTNNPWDPTRTAGGSSGGSAAAVAARLVPLAGGADGGGSIRIPASCCGIFGLKPTRGRTPTGPDVGEIWRGFAQEHVLTLSVRDSAAMLDAIAGPDAGAPYWAPPPQRPYLQEVTTEPGRLRIAFTSHPFLGRDVHEDCRKGLEAAVRLLERLGHELVEAAPQIGREEFAIAFLTMLAAETRDEIDWAAGLAGRRTSVADFEAGTSALALLGQAFSAGDYAKALNYLMAAGRAVGRFFEDYDVLLTPTLSQPPVLTGSLQPSGREVFMVRLVGRLKAAWLLKTFGVIKPLADKIFDFMPYTPVFNVTGQPAMSVPLYWNEAGLPIGMQVVGRFGDEATLFRLAGQLERAQPWFNRTPAL
jgi:amidase